MNNQEVSTAYVGSTEIKECRLGSQLVLAPNGDALWYKANKVPTLDLRFAGNKSLVDATTGQNLVAFTRASSGTYVGSDGLIKTATTDAPRFDHDPTTGESLGLLVEESRTNLLLRSEELDNVYWTNAGGGLVTPNATTAPDGTLTADMYTTTGAGQSIYPSAGTAVSPNTSYAFSVYVKLGTMAVDRYKIAFYDVSNTAFIAVDVVPAQVPTTDAWTRVVYTLTTPAGCTNLRAYLFRNSDTIPSSTVYLWGAQLEQGSFPTSYIKTEASAATRAADLASISNSNFSGWYRQDEGTVFAETQFPAGTAVNTSSRSVFDATDGSTDNRVNVRAIRSASTEDQLTIRSGSSTTAQFSSNGTAVSTASRRLAVVYKVDDFASWATGATSAATDTSGAVPVGVNQVYIGSSVTAAEYLSGAIRRLTYWPQRLGNEVLQRITQ